LNFFFVDIKHIYLSLLSLRGNHLLEPRRRRISAGAS